MPQPISKRLLTEARLGSDVATLTSGKLSATQLPDLAIMDYLGDVASQSAMLALTGQKGDWCTRTDTNTDWIITGTNPSQIGSWRARPLPASALTKTEAATTYTPFWLPNTAYLTGARVVNPSGDLVTAKVGFTSGASYNSGDWNLSTSYATPAQANGAAVGMALVFGA